MGSRSERASRWLVPAALGSAALIAAIVADIRPASAFSTDGHERITRNAFPFMTRGVLDTIVAGNLDEDEGDEANLAERHAQNCRFRDSAAYVNRRYENIVATLIPARTKGATLVVLVPGTARSWTVRDHRGGFGATFAIKVTPNSC